MPPIRRRNIDPEKEERIRLALKALKAGKVSSLKHAAESYSVPVSTLGHRFAGRTAWGNRQFQHKQLLTQAEETVLAKHMENLWKSGFPSNYNILRAMAGKMAGRPVGINWCYKFLARHPQLTTVRSRLLESKRGKANDVESMLHWFCLYNKIVKTHKILNENIWNMDEKGFIIGFGKPETIIVPTSCRKQRFCAHDATRESVTMVECVSATGEYCSPLVIYSGKVHILDWHRNYEKREGWLWGTSDKGVTNEHLSLAWLENCFQPTTARIAGGSKRLLILDGHGSHVTADFIDFCLKNKIILLCLPPHSTHYLQPLDVGLFSHYATAYKREVNEYSRFEDVAIGKPEFKKLIGIARTKAFTKCHIIGGWKGAGLVPFDALRVLEKLPEFQKGDHIESLREIIPEHELQLLQESGVQPFPTPQCSRTLQTYIDAVDALTALHLSSPLQQQYNKIIKVAAESFPRRKVLEVTNEKLTEVLRTKRNKKEGGKTHLSKARVLADAEIEAAVEAAEKRVAARSLGISLRTRSADNRQLDYAQQFWTWTLKDQ